MPTFFCNFTLQYYYSLLKNTIMENTVRCNNCDWEGVEEELQMFEDKTNANSIDRSFFKGCPNCETDDYLMDL
jgi:hypothetical protein